LDLLLPKLDGFEVLKALQQQAQFNNTPVIIYSNLAKPESMQKAKDLSVPDYYVKSQTDVGDLCTRIQKLLIEAPTKGRNQILQSNSLDVSGQFKTMDHSAFKAFLKEKEQESGLIIRSELTGNYGDDLALLARLQGFLNDTPALGQKRYAVAKASPKLHEKYIDDFNSGIIWQNNEV
jgi:response regulator RpfG family c-di-GMP phosphodiesterase